MYHAHSWFDPANLISTQQRTFGVDPTIGPMSSVQGVGDPTFQGYVSDDDPQYPGPE